MQRFWILAIPVVLAAGAYSTRAEAQSEFVMPPGVVVIDGVALPFANHVSYPAVERKLRHAAMVLMVPGNLSSLCSDENVVRPHNGNPVSAFRGVAVDPAAIARADEAAWAAMDRTESWTRVFQPIATEAELRELTSLDVQLGRKEIRPRLRQASRILDEAGLLVNVRDGLRYQDGAKVSIEVKYTAAPAISRCHQEYMQIYTENLQRVGLAAELIVCDADQQQTGKATSGCNSPGDISFVHWQSDEQEGSPPEMLALLFQDGVGALQGVLQAVLSNGMDSHSSYAGALQAIGRRLVETGRLIPVPSKPVV